MPSPTTHEYKLSIVIAFYNSGRTIARTIDSLKTALDQVEKSYIQLIFVDNNSTDEASVIVDNYCATNIHASRVVEFEQGVSQARNLGLLKASGSYIAFVDSDDTIHRNYLSVILSLLPFDCDTIILTDLIKSNNNSHVLTDKIETVLSFLRGWWSFQFVFKRGLAVGIKFSGDCYEDFGFFPFILERSISFGLVFKPLYKYIDNPNSLTHRNPLWRLAELESTKLKLIEGKVLADSRLIDRVKIDYLEGKMALRTISCIWPILTIFDSVAYIRLSQKPLHIKIATLIRRTISVLKRKVTKSFKSRYPVLK